MRRPLLANLMISMLLIVHLSQPSILALASYSPAQTKGRINGKVLDLNADPIAFAPITISGETLSKEIVADEHGGYEIELPVGLYHISSVVPGFAPFRRASFRIEADTTKTLNLVLTLGGIICAIGSKKDPYKDGNGPPQYDDVSLSQQPTGEQEVIVRFRLSQEENRIVEYRAGSIDPRVMVSYDVLAIYADKVRLDKTKAIIEAEGRVIVEDGQRRKGAKYVKLEVQGGKVLLTTDRKSE